MAEYNQRFDTFEQWHGKGPLWLTRHADYREGGAFQAICYDTKGRLCRIGKDFMRARDEKTFPIRWVWPDQVAAILAVQQEDR